MPPHSGSAASGVFADGGFASWAVGTNIAQDLDANENRPFNKNHGGRTNAWAVLHCDTRVHTFKLRWAW